MLCFNCISYLEQRNKKKAIAKKPLHEQVKVKLSAITVLKPKQYKSFPRKINKWHVKLRT